MSVKIEDAFVYPTNIGSWVSYEVYSNVEQVQEQKESLIDTGLYNGLGEIRFIYTKQMKELHDFLDNSYPNIRIENTETVLEDEIYYTSKIEGAKTTRVRTSELHNGAEIKKDDVFSERMVKNGFDAVKLLNIYDGYLDEQDLRHIWLVLTDGCRENESIMGDLYRSGDVFAGDFEAASYKDVPELMQKWFAFYKSEICDEMPFIKASLLHYAFETIHPFCDGNGRLGRLLINNYLIDRNIESARAVSFSMQIDKTRSLYDASFTKSENKMNDCTPFIEYFLETMSSSYVAALEAQKEIGIQSQNNRVTTRFRR